MIVLFFKEFNFCTKRLSQVILIYRREQHVVQLIFDLISSDNSIIVATSAYKTAQLDMIGLVKLHYL